MFFCEWRRAYPRMQGAIHGKTAQKNNADCLEFFQLSTRRGLCCGVAEKEKAKDAGEKPRDLEWSQAFLEQQEAGHREGDDAGAHHKRVTHAAQASLGENIHSRKEQSVCEKEAEELQAQDVCPEPPFSQHLLRKGEGACLVPGHAPDEGADEDPAGDAQVAEYGRYAPETLEIGGYCG